MGAELRVTEERAIDSGLVDYAVPITQDMREALQREACRGHLLRLMKTVR